MEKLTVKITGTKPMLMHSAESANKFSPKTKILSAMTGGRKKTPEQEWEIMFVSWQLSMYIHNGEIVVPAANLLSCFRQGARKQKKGKQFESGVVFLKNYYPLSYDGERIVVDETVFPDENLRDMFDRGEHVNLSQVVVSRSRITRVRPIFDQWSLTVDMEYEPDVITREELIRAINDAGSLIGLGDWRPLYGTFNVEIV